MSAQLEARVAAVNRANEYANQLYKELVEVFQPFVGKMILNSDGSFKKPIVDRLPNMPNTLKLRVISTNQLIVTASDRNHFLAWTVEAKESDGINVYSHDTSVTLGGMNDGFLTRIIADNERPIYTVLAILEAREVYEEAKRAARAARSALGPFWEYD